MAKVRICNNTDGVSCKLVCYLTVGRVKKRRQFLYTIASLLFGCDVDVFLLLFLIFESVGKQHFFYLQPPRGLGPSILSLCP